MRRYVKTAVSVIALAVVAACGGQGERSDEVDEMGVVAAADGNLLLAEWTGPYSGVPAFDRMDLAAVKPALEAGMAMNLAEIDAITENPEPPTFENTIAALERTGR
ncbi:MAG TPA: M3 family peptidase, partial [Gemmatimonadota bacterium]|nr:M3 family peptidase [Gemmatimonadota bacterium]